MSIEKRIIRLERNGPGRNGIPEMKCGPADFQSPLPTQHVHVYYSDPAIGLNVGVWDGTAQTFRGGVCFFVPKGTVCSWTIKDHVKKHYAILDL